ncbi:hypothetical protein [Actinomycetospora termitidis]|uniref:Uncharacterized protein n=1 Tax=Actinomycetospora termitidis TaxID=3053470 RepID=A0ABT7MJ80_9PSEU|nr:hypothetical protein [Actinomycetospora sp. Odt1-22]MDL5159418.1 hypothetical protein [Actinomycetospora sp. Odt1-22]
MDTVNPVDAGSTEVPKTVQEHLCLAQAALAERVKAGLDRDMSMAAIGTLNEMLRQINEHRPVGDNGKHGVGRCTETCGCEGHHAPWSLTFWPECSCEQ